MDNNTTTKEEPKCDAAAHKQCMCHGCKDCQANAREYHKKMGHSDEGIEA